MPGAYSEQIPAVKQAVRGFADRVRNEISTKTVLTETGVPYFTGMLVDGKEMWAVTFDFGALPNQTVKLLMMPLAILNTWGPQPDRWVDLSRTYAFDLTTGITLPIPHTSLYGGSVDLPEWNSQDIYVEGNKITRQGFVYQAQWNTENQRPEENSGQYDVWLNLGSVESSDLPRVGQDAAVINVYLDGNALAIETSTDRSDYQATVSIVYLRPAQT